MKHTFTFRLTLSLLFGLLCSTGLVAQVVTSSADDGSAGTLRSQIAAAAPGASITVDFTVSNIKLTAGDIVIDKSLTITGNIFGSTTIDGDGLSRIFDVSAGTLTLNNMTLTNGVAGNGGAIQIVGASVIANNVDFENNTADGVSGSGGAILVGVGASFTALNSSFTNNVANRAGGAIEAVAGTT